jgi:DnaD-like protein
MIALPKKQKPKGRNVRAIEEKWTAALIKPGWTAIPQVFLDKQKALGLDAIDLNIILHIVKHWWKKDTLPYPAKHSIAECMGIDESTVRRRIARMEKDGLIRRVPRYDASNGQRANEYHFDGLIKAATPYAREISEDKDRRKKEDADSRRRKRLRIVPKQGE